MIALSRQIPYATEQGIKSLYQGTCREFLHPQNHRSGGCSRGRGVFRLSTTSCWRIAKLSKYVAASARSSRCRRATRSRVSTFRMAERLSGRWPVSQGYCGGRGFDEPQAMSAFLVWRSALPRTADATGRGPPRPPLTQRRLQPNWSARAAIGQIRSVSSSSETLRESV